MSDLQIQRGPCVLCGAINYPLSMGGPTICCSCDCGVPPATRLRAENVRLRAALMSVQHNRLCSCYASGGPCPRCVIGYDDVDTALASGGTDGGEPGSHAADTSLAGHAPVEQNRTPHPTHADLLAYGVACVREGNSLGAAHGCTGPDDALASVAADLLAEWERGSK